MKRFAMNVVLAVPAVMVAAFIVVTAIEVPWLVLVAKRDR
jgi:hypothetical protein